MQRVQECRCLWSGQILMRGACRAWTFSLYFMLVKLERHYVDDLQTGNFFLTLGYGTGV